MTISNPLIAAGLAAELADIEREAPVPSPPFGYGRDLSCVSDCTDNFDEVDPNSKQGLAEVLIRRVTTTQGTVLDDPDQGFNLYTVLNRPASAIDILRVGDRVRAEWKKDDRVADAVVTLTYDAATETIEASASVDAVDPVLGTFNFTFAVTADGAELLETIV
jgi:hypothetical protein